MTKDMTALHVTVGQSTEKNWLEVSSQILIISHSIFCMFTAIHCSTNSLLETRLGRTGEQSAALLCFVLSTERTGQ